MSVKLIKKDTVTTESTYKNSHRYIEGAFRGTIISVREAVLRRAAVSSARR